MTDSIASIQPPDLTAALANVYRLPDELAHQLLVDDELVESREEYVSSLAAKLDLAEEDVEAAVEARPFAVAGVGSLATLSVEGALSPDGKAASLAIVWQPSDEWVYVEVAVPSTRASSLRRALREQLESMAQELSDLSGADVEDEEPDVSVFPPPAPPRRARGRSKKSG
jgi:hypothetical protein